MKCESPDDKIRQVKNSSPGTRCLCDPLVGGLETAKSGIAHGATEDRRKVMARTTIGRTETPIY